MSRDAPLPPPPDVWQIQYLRLISFPVEPQYSTQQRWWQELTGIERDSCVEKKHERHEEGTFDGTSFSLSIDLLRLQWTAAPRASVETEGFQTIGPFLARLNWFKEQMHRWLAVSPATKRLAIAALLLQPTETRETGYSTLNQYLRCVDLDVQSTDFLYRINRPSQSNSGIPELAINRLTTWSVAKIFRQQIAISPTGGETQPAPEPGESACFLEFDINTAADPSGRELARESVTLIFDELVELALRVATNGDDCG